jgi:hypothetical protein
VRGTTARLRSIVGNFFGGNITIYTSLAKGPEQSLMTSCVSMHVNTVPPRLFQCVTTRPN